MLTTFLARLPLHPQAHARFVNTLSLLEYMGARKIFKSQRAECFTSELLSHAAEEIRHAQMLRRVACSMSEGAIDSYREDQLLCGAEARRYFQAIDHLPAPGMDEAFRYRLTTWLIEERAVGFYKFYDPVLSASGHPGVLQAILKDEDRHLEETRAGLAGLRELAAPLMKLEERAFSELLAAWEGALPISAVKRVNRSTADIGSQPDQ